MPQPAAPDPLLRAVPPTRVWLLLGHKAGDNTQVLALAERLGWAYAEKRIAYRPWELLSNRLLQVTLAGVDRRRSSALEPPWPDLVISSGRRNEPVARWIRQQSAARTRLVHVGRPWAPVAAFDLVISTPQYPLAGFPNVVQNDLPMHRLQSEALQRAGAQWRATLATLPSPRIVVLLGGNSGASGFTAEKARRMGMLVDALARTQGGSVMVTDSARTPSEAMEAFIGAINVPTHCHRWGSARRANPYLGYLALGEQFVVTADSMSMVAEAEFTGKPVYLFSLEDGPDWWRRAYNYRFSALAHRLAMACGPRRMRRDVAPMLEALVRDRRAAWLGEDICKPLPVPRRDDTLQAALAVAGLFSTRQG